ncbi:hypothetical protein F2Q69_00014380 [Brassica cretica]|uniref:Uncharacterized protein n=1 Tax=Brassica cretica TaxID=69181 RepID=A0A8S9QVM5_BRACR|nr:hypothetical protein F2Q69_00014380 [Brassica cretica]
MVEAAADSSLVKHCVGFTSSPPPQLRQTRLWSSTALASPPHHHHRFIKEQGKEKQWYDIAAFPDQAWCGGEVVVVRWRCEHHGRRRVKKNVVWWLY